MSLAVDHTTAHDPESPISAGHPAETRSLDGWAALDALVDALAAGRHAQVICAALGEVSAEVAWLQTQSPSGSEPTSLRRVVDGKSAADAALVGGRRHRCGGAS